MHLPSSAQFLSSSQCLKAGGRPGGLVRSHSSAAWPHVGVAPGLSQGSCLSLCMPYCPVAHLHFPAVTGLLVRLWSPTLPPHLLVCFCPGGCASLRPLLGPGGNGFWETRFFFLKQQICFLCVPFCFYSEHPRFIYRILIPTYIKRPYAF